MLQRLQTLLRWRYSLALLFTVGAGLLFVVGVLTVDALIGAALVLLGAALKWWSDAQAERRSAEADQRAAEAKAEEERRADLDETRRLCYAAPSAGTAPGNPMLAATIVNALVHHQGVDEQEALAHVPTVVNGSAGPSADWIRGKIARITAEMGYVPAE